MGAGAAGLVAAIVAARQGRRVALVERTADGGRKILISGGGRCNVLPRALEPERFVSNSPVLVRKLLRSWPLVHQRAFFEDDLGIPLKLEEDSGKYFPISDRARDVRDALVRAAKAAGVAMSFGVRVDNIEADHNPALAEDRWIVHTSHASLGASSIVLATGGSSVPATGSDGAFVEIVRRLGHTVHPTYPALTPLTAEPAVHAGLSGVSLPVRIRAKWRGRETEAHGGFLFTHRGYSGPAVLDVSHVAVQSALAGDDDRAVLRVRWCELDQNAWTRILEDHAGLVTTALARQLPTRLAERLAMEAGIPPDRRSVDLRKAERTTLLENLTSYVLPWTGDEGYKKAEVTGGGVALDEVDPKRLESRRCPGLYICGEMLDAFGPIGGHNFAWAWATGRMAGLAAGTCN